MDITVKFNFPKDIDDRIPDSFIFGDILKTIPFKDVTFKVINRSCANSITMDYIEATVCEYIQCTPEELQTKTRKREVVIGRQICHYLSREYTKNSLASIGHRFGKKDHATVKHSKKTICDLMDGDKDFQREYLPLINSFQR